MWQSTDIYHSYSWLSGINIWIINGLLETCRYIKRTLTQWDSNQCGSKRVNYGVHWIPIFGVWMGFHFFPSFPCGMACIMSLKDRDLQVQMVKDEVSIGRRQSRLITKMHHNIRCVGLTMSGNIKSHISDRRSEGYMYRKGSMMILV